MVKSKTGKSKSHLIAESAAIDIGRRLNESANSLRRAGRALGDNSADFDHSRKAARLGASGLVPPLSATGTQSLNILLIDDSLELPKVYARTSQRLNGRMRVQSCNPTSVQDAIIAIRKALRASPPVNLLLIDHQLQGELCGEHIFQALNALQHSDDLPLRYLPRAAITESPDETKTLADTMLALGADAVYFEKAQVQPRAASSSDNGEVGQDTPVEQFLRSLLDTEYKEMRARAWGRVWRDTRNRVEEQILSQRENSCISTLQLQELVAKCWYLISRNLVDSGYVKRANFRIFSGSRLESIEPVTPELRRYGLASIDWDDLPYVQRWLIQACADASNGQTGEWIKYCVPKLAQADIIPVSVHIDSRYNAFLELLRGNAVMGMPLITQHGPIGLFVLVREPGSPAFGQTDWDQMRTLGLRLASYVQDLSSQVREFQRRQGLVTLYQELQSAPNESGLLQIALHHVHEMVFSAALGLHGSPQMPPRTGVDDDGRSTVRWLSPDGCYPGWGLGAGVSNPSLIPLNKRPHPTPLGKFKKSLLLGNLPFFRILSRCQTTFLLCKG